MNKSAEELCKEAERLFGENKYKDAIALWRDAANENCAQALYMLGVCYNFNLGIDEPDEAKRGVIASDYFVKAAELGHADAQCFAGLCYLHGIGVERDETAALSLLHKAAKQDCTQAINNLALLCDKGVGVAPDQDCATECFKWFKKSADLGDPTGQYYVGKAYYDGHGVACDYSEAVKWYELSARQGFADALFCLGECYDDGDGVEENAEDAFCLYLLAAQKNHAKAQCYVGYCYENGAGVERNMREALRWYEL